MTVIKILQIVMVLALTFLVLIQSKGGGLASTFGNAAGYYRTRRGVERLVFSLTIVLSILIVANSMAIILLS